MKSALHAMVAIVVIVLVAGCASTSATHDFNPSVDFDDYRTFSWVSRNPLVAAPEGANPLLEDRLEQTTLDLLSAKGYRFVADPKAADFVIGFALGATEKVRIESYPARYRGAWHWGGAGVQEVSVQQHIEGRLTVDIFDVATQQPAWHGWATRRITSSVRKEARQAIRDALTAILANFPPR